MSFLGLFLITEKLSYSPKYSVGTKSSKKLPDLGPELVNPITNGKGYHAKFYNEPVDFIADRNLFDEYNLTDASLCLIDYFNKRITNDILISILMLILFLKKPGNIYLISLFLVLVNSSLMIN